MALTLANEHHLTEWQGRAYHRLSQIQVSQGDYEATRQSLRQARRFAQEAGQKELEARILNSLGIVGMETAVYAQGEKDFHAALQLFVELDKKIDMGNVYSNLAVILGYQNRIEVAVTYAQQARAHHQQAGHRRGYNNTLLILATLTLEQGDFSKALALYEEAAVVCREIDYPTSLAIALISTGTLYLRLGQNELAHPLLTDGLNLARELDAKYVLTAGLDALGYLYLRTRDFLEAVSLFDEGFSLAQEIGAASLMATIQYHQGLLQMVQGNVEQAIILYRKALPAFRDIGELHKAMEPLAALADIHWQRGEHEQARLYANEILQFIETNFPSDLIDPFYIYAVCHDILDADQDPRATALCKDTYELLQKHADSIEQPNWKKSFLESWESHRRIMTAFRT
ncbi:tetratricopeptide repeat protein [Chloroflexi bacterium TSY]|nr:tetratricopeptide repeat protein [Chloroflexi bacterium TSY]